MCRIRSQDFRTRIFTFHVSTFHARHREKAERMASSPHPAEAPQSGSWSNPNRLLLGPGPSGIHPRVLLAMAQPTIGHLDPAFLKLMDRIQDGLRRLFGTQNAVTFAVSGTGMAGMETCLCNLLEP